MAANQPQGNKHRRFERRDGAFGKWPIAGWLALVSLVVLGAAAMLGDRSVSSPTHVARETHSVSRGDLLVTVTEQGTVESFNNTEVKCEIRGGYGGRGGQSRVTWVIPPGTFVNAGDELVRLDTRVIDETISLGKTDTNSAKAQLAQAEADAAIARSAIKAYLDGTFRSRMEALRNQLVDASWNLQTARSTLQESKSLYRQAYISRFEVKANEYTVKQAQLERNVKQTEIDVLDRYTKVMQIERLNGQVRATKSRLEGRKAGVELEQGRLGLALEELEHCVIRAPRAGLVIYPSAAKWKDTPDIAEGVSVHNNQVLLVIPDLNRVQVTIAIHESIVDRVKPGQEVQVRLPKHVLNSTVHSVAAIATPAGWWNGTAVRYDTVVRLPVDDGFRPGMTAEVEVTLARHRDVLTVPVSAVVETPEGHFCWIETDTGVQRRPLQLGDANHEAIIVEAGLAEGDVIVPNPIRSLPEARAFIEPTRACTASHGDLLVTLTEQGTLASSNNTEIKCRVRGESTVTWVIESGTQVRAGDVLVRLENKQIEEHIRERTKFAFLSKDAAIGYRVEATVAELAIQEYLEGRYRTELLTLEKDLAIAQQNMLTAQNLLVHAKKMHDRGFKSQLDVDEQVSAVQHSGMTVKTKQLEIDVLKDFTRAEELVTLRGNWEAAKEAAKGHEEVLKNDEARIALANEELEQCVIRAPVDGLVIYPRGEEWKDEPEVSEGSTAHNNQILLLMPDLSRMHVQVGIHESMRDLVQPGMRAQVTLPHDSLEGQVTSVASVAEPAGWWTGNVVKYDAIVQLPLSAVDLKPGMSAEVEIELARHKHVLMIPLSAVVTTGEGSFCWVGMPDQAERRAVKLGDNNDEFVVVEEGLEVGEQVVFNPQEWIETAER